MGLSPKEIERLLGEQYADVLQRNPHAQGVARDCKEVIDASLAAMEHYNRMTMALRNMTSGMRRGPAPAGAAPMVEATQASGKAACSCTGGATCPSCSKGS